MLKKTIKVFILTAILWNVMAIETIQAQAPDRTLQDYSVQELIKHFATKYQVSESRMSATIRCESSFNPNAIGDGGKSFGLSQIYLPAHLSTTREQALNPVYAVEFMAKKFSENKARLWTCHRNIYGVK